MCTPDFTEGWLLLVFTVVCFAMIVFGFGFSMGEQGNKHCDVCACPKKDGE